MLGLFDLGIIFRSNLSFSLYFFLLAEILQLRPKSSPDEIFATHTARCQRTSVLWTDNRDHLQDGWKRPIRLDKEHASTVRKTDAPMHYPAQHDHLVMERSIFGVKSALRLKWRDQDVKDKT
jgi:hypothetical protein